MILAAIFAIFAVIGLTIALLDFLARTNSAAPSMHAMDLSVVGGAIFIVFGLLAAAALLGSVL